MSDERVPHKLMGQLMAANVSEEEIAELYEDLKYVFDSPFDTAIGIAVDTRGCTYVEFAEQRPN
jgi:hypothetical protein